MKWFITLIFALQASVCLAGNSYPNDNSHNLEDEAFNPQDMSQAAHLFAGAAMSIATHQILMKTGMKPIPAVLCAMATSALIGTAKEVFFDDYTSKNGIKSFWVGSAIGGALSLTLTF